MGLIPEWMTKEFGRDKNTILTPVEQRIFGLVHIVQGLSMLAIGDRTPPMALSWIMQKTKEKMDNGTHPAANR